MTQTFILRLPAGRETREDGIGHANMNTSRRDARRLATEIRVGLDCCLGTLAQHKPGPALGV